jgi:hypothetical protein
MSTTPNYKTILDLDPANAPSGAEVIEVVQDGISRKMPLSAIQPEIPEPVPTSELPPAAAKTGAELIEVEQEGVAKSLTLAEALAFDRYDLKVVASNGALDLSKQQVFTVDNTTAAAKTISLTGAPAGRAAVFVIVIAGKAGAITWPVGMTWNSDTPPDLGVTRTVVVLLWDGANFTGAQGPTK